MVIHVLIGCSHVLNGVRTVGMVVVRTDNAPSAVAIVREQLADHATTVSGVILAPRLCDRHNIYMSRLDSHRLQYAVSFFVKW